MKTYIIKRFLLMIPTLFGVSVVVWVVLTSAPRAPITMQASASMEQGKETKEGGGVEESVKIFRAQYGLDKPAILNTYFSLDKEEVRRALEDFAAGPNAVTVKTWNKAQERLIEWGYYAVPVLMELLEETQGNAREETMRWLVRSAKRVAVGAETGRVDAETVRRTTEIIEEGKILELMRWKTGASEERKQAGIASIQAWYRGMHGAYEPGPSDEEVRNAVVEKDSTKLEAWGEGAVPALVHLVLEDEVVRDDAVTWLVRNARRPLPEDPAGAEARRLEHQALDHLPWEPTDPLARKLAGVDLVRTWWNGAESKWDYSGLKSLRVLFLETQFASYWANLLSFDLGNSMVHKIPVFDLILQRLKYSLTLAGSSLLLAYLISVPLGILSARIHGSVPERAISLVVFALYSLPSFFVATLVVRFLAEGQPGSLEWIPDGRFEDVESWRFTTWDKIKDIAWHVGAPIFCMTYASFAALSRYAKTGLLNVIHSDYVRTARAKGLSEFVVLMKHAARNGIIPVITLLATTLPVIVSGSFIIEWIFSIPGFGLLTLQSIFARDYNVIIGITLIIAVLTMLGILLSDLLYAVADPRISYS